MTYGLKQVLGLVLSLSVVACFDFTPIPKDRPFSSSEWKATPQGTLRFSMVSDLLKHKHNFILGKSSKEIVLLLGEPDSKEDNRFLYYTFMGPEIAMPQILNIEFGPGGATDTWMSD